MAKTIKNGICDWFFKVVEAKRKLNSLEAYTRNGKELVELCLGNDKTIHIYDTKQFDRLVEALISVYDENFVGKVKDEISKTTNGKGFVWRSFKYAEFEVGTIVKNLGEGDI